MRMGQISPQISWRGNGAFVQDACDARYAIAADDAVDPTDAAQVDWPKGKGSAHAGYFGSRVGILYDGLADFVASLMAID